MEGLKSLRVLWRGYGPLESIIDKAKLANLAEAASLFMAEALGKKEENNGGTSLLYECGALLAAVSMARKQAGADGDAEHATPLSLTPY